ncbi:hypothetical protein F8568_031940 [Actinomadura sp. LD22]|uniref:Uncharacterized protein n=1 Tax=Actinomadura physcomitrii TaxID=2650748 RepID=A0A6I4MN23_9ACTN|nr:hypothetical protein [Actinomadura physcomitrii]MWA04901.1 hypothetical protein [Actinomadura physcomitrii]
MSEVLLTAADEYLCHQSVASFEQVTTTDRNWTEKGYIVAHDVSGEVLIAVGIGKYTNRDVMDAFAGIAVPGRQWNVRASRELRPDLDRTTVGPIVWEVVSPPTTNRVALADNELDVSFDVTFQSDFAPIVGSPGLRRDRGITTNHTIRYFQPGRASGEVHIAGRTYVIAPERSNAYKDRSWGIRSMTGVPSPGAFWFNDPAARPEAALRPAPPPGEGVLHGYLNLNFGSWALSSTFTQGPDGRPIQSSTGASEGFVVFANDARPRLRITSLELDFEFWPNTRRAKSLNAHVQLEDGSKREISCSWKDLVYYFRGGGYFGFRGWWQGGYRGPLDVAGESLDLRDKAVLDELYGCEEIAVDCVCDDEIGHGVIEPWAIGSLPRYGITEEMLG